MTPDDKHRSGLQVGSRARPGAARGPARPSPAPRRPAPGARDSATRVLEPPVPCPVPCPLGSSAVLLNTFFFVPSGPSPGPRASGGLAPTLAQKVARWWVLVRAHAQAWGLVPSWGVYGRQPVGVSVSLGVLSLSHPAPPSVLPFLSL